MRVCLLLHARISECVRADAMLFSSFLFIIKFKALVVALLYYHVNTDSSLYIYDFCFLILFELSRHADQFL